MLSVAHSARQGAKAIAQRLLPPSVVVWRKQRRVSGPGQVALTFDDGPDRLTPDYLAVLDTLGARATFFVLGAQCRAHPELVHEMLRRGHELASHGFSHRPFPELSPEELALELAQTRELLPTAAQGRLLVRPPFGATSARALMTCVRAGFTTVLWSIDSGDWRPIDASAISESLRQRPAVDGDIVLLHEGQRTTLDALPAIVAGLTEAGHELVTVSELLA